MKYFKKPIFLTFYFVFTALCFTAATQPRQKKAVFIIADGIPADVIEKLKLPNINAMSKEGSYLRAHVGGEKGGYSETPTISANGYNSLLTGTWVNKHNVWGNDIKDPNYNYHNIFRLFKEEYPTGQTAIFSSWLYNRTRLAGDGLPGAGNLKIDIHFDGYELDTIQFPHDKAGDYMHHIDEKVVEEASNTLQQIGPDVSWVYLEYTDDMGHKFGDSPQFYNAVQYLDKQIGSIYKAIQFRQKNYNEDWMIIVTTDHGRNEETGKDHGGQSQRQRSTWIVSNKKLNNAYANYYQPSIVDIMPTIARHLNMHINKNQLFEIDGTPLTGPVSIAALNTNYFQKQIDISWKNLLPDGMVKIWLSTQNNFKSGQKDDYILIGQVPAAQQHYLINVSNHPSAFYKVVIEADYNVINRWVFTKTEK